MTNASLTIYELPYVSPNPTKVLVLLNKLKLEYETIIKEPNDDEKKGVKGADFLEVNPNGRVPALVDSSENITVFESNAILTYLAEKYDPSGTYLGRNPSEKALINSWLYHQASGLGPVQGQVVYLNIYFEKFYGEVASEAVKKRFSDEVDRLYKVLEGQLKKQNDKGIDWIVLDRLTNVDIAFFGWVTIAHVANIDLSVYPHVDAWFKKMEQDEGVVAFRKRHPK